MRADSLLLHFQSYFYTLVALQDTAGKYLSQKGRSQRFMTGEAEEELLDSISTGDDG